MTKRFSILMASDDFVPAGTGVGTHIKILAPELVKRGHSVAVITSRRRGEPAEENWQGVKVFRVFSIPAYGFYQALPSRHTLRRIIDATKPDVIHHHYVGYLMMRLCGIAEALKLPQVSTYHFSSEVLTQPLLMRPFAGLIRRLLMSYNNRFQLIIAPSRNLARQIQAEGVATPVQYISNPVVFSGQGTDSIDCDRSCFTVLYAGRFGVEKNIPLLIRAFAQLAVERPDAVLEIAGKGPELSELQRLCVDLKLGSRVRFLGFLDHSELAKCYARCNVFVLPSVVETQGLVAMEAMRFGKPIIVTKAIVSAEELVTDGENGFIVDPNVPEQLAAKLLSIASDSQMGIAMGKAGARRAESYQPDLVVEQTELAYHGVMS